jgi:hypothetical protein
MMAAEAGGVLEDEKVMTTDTDTDTDTEARGDLSDER